MYFPYILQVLHLVWFIVAYSFDHEKTIRNVFGLNSLFSHNISEEVSQDVLHSDSIFNDDIQPPYLACGSLSLIKSTKQTLQRAKGKDSAKTAFMKKSIDTGCLLISSDTAFQMSSIFDEFTYSQIETFPFPYAMKIDSNAVKYLNNKMSTQDAGSYTSSTSDNSTDSEEINLLKSVFNEVPSTIRQIDLEFTPNALQKNSASYWSNQIFQTNPSTTEFLESNLWNELLFSKVGLTSATLKRRLGSIDCDTLPSSTSIEVTSESTHLINLSDIHDICLGAFIHHVVRLPYVLRVSLGTKPMTFNHDAKGLTTAGVVTITDSLFETFGLNGENQIVGVADTGINDLSCYFQDDSEAYPTITTDRTGQVESLRRKVIQYVGYADSVDDVSGHGTHVAGTVLGSNLYSDSTKLNGVAPNAKVAFYDVGVSGDPFLYIPDLYNKLFPTAYAAGARVHTNSWGSSDSEYSYMSKDVDRFLYKNQDFLILFAAGNSGSAGLYTVGTPSNSKNCLTVGSTEVRAPEDDSLLSESTVAWFSSLGPTIDERIKPEVVAPGSYVVSAFSGSGNILNTDTSTAESASGSCNCATTSKMGTSMATPVVAGLALLLRQYFMDPSFWASQCNSMHTTCQSGAFTPSGYLLKALLIHSSQAIHRYSIPEFDFKTSIDSFRFKRLYENLPDVMQGYGAVMLGNILPVISSSSNNENVNNDNREFDLIIFDQFEFQEYATYEWNITFDLSGNHSNSNSNKVLPLKVTLTWFDPPSTVGFTSVLLIHDLDLMIVTPDGEILWGNNHKSGGDEHNPTEQLTVEKLHSSCEHLSACVYRVYVRSNALPEAEVQKAAIVFTTTGIASGPELTDNSLPFHHKDYTSGGDDDYIYSYNSSNYYYYYYYQSESIDVNKSSSSTSTVSKHATRTEATNNSTVDSKIATTTTAAATTSTSDASNSNSNSIIFSEKSVSFPSTGLYVKMNEGGTYYRNIVTIGAFAYSGELSSIKVSLQYSKYYDMKSKASTSMCSGIYPFIMSLIVIDPEDNRIQIGGNGWFASDDKLYTREWPRTWVRYFQASHIFEAIRGVTNAELDGAGRWKLEVAIGFDWEISPTYYRGDVTLEYASDTNSPTTQFCELPVALYDTFGDGWNGAGVVVTGVNNSYTGFYGPLDPVFYQSKTEAIRVVLGLTVKLSIGYDSSNSNEGTTTSYLREPWEMFWEVNLPGGSYTGDYQTSMTFTCNMTTRTTSSDYHDSSNSNSSTNTQPQDASEEVLLVVELADSYAIYATSSYANSTATIKCNTCHDKKPKPKPTATQPVPRLLLASTQPLPDKTTQPLPDKSGSGIRGPPTSSLSGSDGGPVKEDGLHTKPIVPVPVPVPPVPPIPPLLLSVNYCRSEESLSSPSLTGRKAGGGGIPVMSFAVSSSDRIQQYAADSLCIPPPPPPTTPKPLLPLPPLVTNNSSRGVLKTDCLQGLEDGSYVFRVAKPSSSSSARTAYNFDWYFCDRSGGPSSELPFEVRGGRCLPGQLLVFDDVSATAVQSMNTLLTYDCTMVLVATEDLSSMNMTSTDRQVLQRSLFLSLSQSLSTMVGVTVTLTHWNILSAQYQYNYDSSVIISDQSSSSNKILQLTYQIEINAEEYGIDGKNYESVQILSTQIEKTVMNRINSADSDNSFIHAMTVANIEYFDYTGGNGFTLANKISTVTIVEFTLSSVSLLSTVGEATLTNHDETSSNNNMESSFIVNIFKYTNVIGAGVLVLVIVLSVVMILLRREKSLNLPNSGSSSTTVLAGSRPKTNRYDPIESNSYHIKDSIVDDFMVNMEVGRRHELNSSVKTGSDYDDKEPLVKGLAPL